MSKLNGFFVIALLITFSINGALIVNEANAGWLGDQLINYIKAKYLSHKYNIPFVLKPFQYSEKFVLDNIDKKISGKLTGLRVINESQLTSSNANEIYRILYQCQIDGWRTTSSFTKLNLFSLTLDFWDDIFNDVPFILEMKKLIALKNSNGIQIPKNISLAIHVRRPLPTDIQPNIPVFRVVACNMYDFYELGERNELGEASEFYKFLPDQYYIDQLIRVAKMMPDEQINACIFTNYSNPYQLCDHYKKELEKKNVFNISLVPQSWVRGVAEELIAMSQFDYLIRSRSNYAQIADFIGNHKVVISPGDLVLYKDKQNRDCLVVETVIIKTKNEDGSYSKKIVSNM